jgi:hypothetical protein
VNGKWSKYPHNPLLQKPGDLVGVGHSSLFRDRNGEWRIVFHAHNSPTEIHPRHMYISTLSFREVDGVEQLHIDPDYTIPLMEVDE